MFVKESEMKDDFAKLANFVAYDLMLIIFVKNK